MRRTLAIVAAMIMSAALLTAVTGCTRVRLADRPETRTQTESKTVALDGAARLDAEIRMAVGELTLRSADASGSAMTADFDYAPAGWKPDVSYAVSEGTGTLVVRQPENVQVNNLGNVRNTWNVRLAPGVPTDLRLRLDVGRSAVDLRGIDLTSLDVITGVGETTIDLSGPRGRGFSARVEASVGKLTLRLPRSVGARVTGGKYGLGSFTADGVSVDSGSWVNDANSGTGPKIDIELQRGIGDLNIILVD